MPQDRSDTSRRQHGPLKGGRKPMAVRAPGLAAGLSRSFPKLGPHEWDFRWVESKEQEATVVA